jgi:hypothetical protein
MPFDDGMMTKLILAFYQLSMEWSYGFLEKVCEAFAKVL